MLFCFLSFLASFKNWLQIKWWRIYIFRLFVLLDRKFYENSAKLDVILHPSDRTVLAVAETYHRQRYNVLNATVQDDFKAMN